MGVIKTLSCACFADRTSPKCRIHWARLATRLCNIKLRCPFASVDLVCLILSGLLPLLIWGALGCAYRRLSTS